MAIYNEILAGRYNRFLQKFLSMKGSPPAPQLASEMSASWALFHGAENRYLEGWDRFAFQQVQVAGGAGTFATIQFRNPLGSGAVVVIEKVLLGGTIADNPFIQIQARSTDQTTIFSPVGGRLDARTIRNSIVVASKGVPAVQITTDSLQVFFGANGNIDLIFTENQELTLLPGDAFLVQSNVANQSVNLSVIFRERILEDSEKT